MRRFEMASRSSCALLMFALLGSLLLLQTALADEVGKAGNGDVITASINVGVGSSTTPHIDQDFTDEAQGVSEDRVDSRMTTNERGKEEFGEIQPYLYVPDQEDEVEVIADNKHQQTKTTVDAATHPLARILSERSSKKCYWNARNCRKFYGSAGCCRQTCVNLSNDNTNCGKCRKHCDTRRGYFCQSGKCRKPLPPPKHTPMCGKTKKCKGGSSCCSGNCVNVEQDCSNCGGCGHNCPWGSACCNRQCKNLNTDFQNCGKCGRRCKKGGICCNGQCVSIWENHRHCGQCGQNCGWGRKCCNGKCVSVTGDQNNCGNCGHKCAKHVKCRYGICGYSN